MSKKAKKLNKYFKSGEFVLVKVIYSSDGQEYTYAAPVKVGVEIGSVVLVPVGDDIDVFSQGDTVDRLSVAVVTDITDDMRHMPKDYVIKMIAGALPKGAAKVYSKTHKKRYRKLKK